MYDTWTGQVKIRIGKHMLGGLPGENPAWLIGSIFYLGDKILLNEKGEFDKQQVKKKIEEAINIASDHGLVFGLDVVLPSMESVENIMSFVSEYDIPLFLDSPDPMIRAKSYIVAETLGISKRVIANGLYIDSPEEEIEAIRNSGIETAVIMAFDPKDPLRSMDPENRLSLINEKLLPLAEKAGVKNILVDAVVIDPASIALSGETVYLVKKLYGYPAGCAPANALGPISKKKVGVEQMHVIHGTVASFLRIMGSDYIMYGPVSRIKYIAPSVALVDSLLGYIWKRQGTKIGRDHPLRKYFKNIQRIFAKS
ncbi:MAG: tetrahydromethanopterin S-methyltransferase subunit H [Staphylothermus sp.]|nr:tetrahydromethanopterin S-methyltransferase subunit H [Staphylothermus sp.]